MIGTYYAVFNGEQRLSQWYIKLGSAKLDWERWGKRYVIRDNHGKDVTPNDKD